MLLAQNVSSKNPSSFDPIAELYHQLWSDWYLPAALPALENLLFSRLSPPARILDVCCGCGHVTKELVRRGYEVTGIDISEELVAIARRELPSVHWEVQDARYLRVLGSYDGALSTFDALNHILTLEDLALVFQGVYRSLRKNGLFVFDMNLEEAFCADLRGWVVEVGDRSTSLVRGLFDERRKIARTELIWFKRDEHGECWRRADTAIEERCYSKDEILTTVEAAGFRNVECVPASEVGMKAELGFGRIFISAWA